MTERPQRQSAERRKRVLAVASGGGHWVQLCRLAPTFSEYDTHFMTTFKGTHSPIAGAPVEIVKDASRADKAGLMILLSQIVWRIVRFRPDVVITTGAAPGLLALHVAKLLGSRTVWIDSIANAEELSLSGKLAHRCADLWLTQWPELVKDHPDLRYEGSVV